MERVIPTSALPDDPALPGLATIRSKGLDAAIPALGLGSEPVELKLCGYSAGERATLDARIGARRLAVKIYAQDPAPEAQLYLAIAAAGLAGGAGPRVPTLLAWDREVRVLVISWLEGRAANELIREGQGTRAGQLAASWLKSAVVSGVTLGPAIGATDVLRKARKWVDVLAGADAGVGSSAASLFATLEWTRPPDGAPYLLHGTYYARHILDLGDGPGVIDWQRFGQGPVELDAGVFLATVTRHALLNDATSGHATQALDAFLACTGWLDQNALAWHWAAALLHLAQRQCKQPLEPGGNRTVRARALLDEGARIIEALSLRRA